MKCMTDVEVIAHLRKWVKHEHGLFEWPTDACGYEQHLRFVDHRNTYLDDWPSRDFKAFVLDYADKLERGEIPVFQERPR